MSEPMVDPHGSVGIRRGGSNGEAKTACGGEWSWAGESSALLAVSHIRILRGDLL